MARLEFERLRQCIEFFGTAAEGFQTAGQVGPKRGMLWVGCGGAFEQRLRLLRGTPIQHAHAKFVQHSRVVGRVLGNACQQLIGFRHATRRSLGLGLSQDTQDGCLFEDNGGGGIQAVNLG